MGDTRVWCSGLGFCSRVTGVQWVTGIRRSGLRQKRVTGVRLENRDSVGFGKQRVLDLIESGLRLRFSNGDSGVREDDDDGDQRDQSIDRPTRMMGFQSFDDANGEIQNPL
ncbi:hypothetical protein U1Q18_029520 [Sarracenia purpurea var. burkii]